MTSILLPVHGKIDCIVCKEMGHISTLPKEWKWRNDPGAWGSCNPSILVLGFSKGSTQADVYRSGNFDDVPFAGSRGYLTTILQRVSLLTEGECVDEKMRKGEKEFAFGSLVRCSLTRLDPKTGKQASSGPLIVKSFTEILDVLVTCAVHFQDPLPNKTRLIVMLGTDDKYIQGCREIMQVIHKKNFQYINEVAYGNDKHTWVHLTHPSPLNGWKKAWLSDPSTTTSGRKRDLAISVIENLGMQRAKVHTGAQIKSTTKSIDKPITKPVQPVAREAKINQDDKKQFCEKFYFLHELGAKLYAVAMKNRDTGMFAYRVSDKGNLKVDSLEVDEATMIRKVFNEGCAVRMSTLDGERTGLYRPPGGGGRSSIIRVVKLPS